jgi:hypothetical protein
MGPGGVEVAMAKRLGMLAVPGLAVALLIGCVAGPGAGAPGSVSPSATGDPTTPRTAPATRADPSIEVAAPPRVPSTCRLTNPTHPFLPPAGYPAPTRPPDYYDAEWYGDAHLWTMLRHGGEIWFGLPVGPGGLFQKTFWWSTDFDVNDEPQPAIAVSGQQLDGPGRFVAPTPGTNAQADFGSAMLTGIDIPTTGCWRITATYRRVSLSYIAWVRR